MQHWLHKGALPHNMTSSAVHEIQHWLYKTAFQQLPSNIRCHRQLFMKCSTGYIKLPSSMASSELHGMQHWPHKAAFQHNMSSSELHD
eukprot:1285379-Karenia_brevis.AAC.1